MIQRTPLYANHVALGAMMVDFHGWEMPLHYGSQLEEHHAVRRDAGMFDVSHMTVVDALGAGGRQLMRYLFTHDVDKLKHVGRALYTCMCNEHGGIIDDLIIYQRASDNYRLILNSATRARCLSWIRDHLVGFTVGLYARTELGMIAIQGPNAIKKTLSILNSAQVDALSTLTPFESVEIDNWFFARTGYTGEDGLEILVPQADMSNLWNNLLTAGIKPCGLAARDTLRLEAGLLLYGQDMDESTTPLESALAWTVTFNPDARMFIGMNALLRQQDNLQRKLVGLTIYDKVIMRAGQRVIVAGFPDGIITSGTYSPTLGHSIAFARVPIETGDAVLVEIRGKLLQARVSTQRFVKLRTTL